MDLLVNQFRLISALVQVLGSLGLIYNFSIAAIIALSVHWMTVWGTFELTVPFMLEVVIMEVVIALHCF